MTVVADGVGTTDVIVSPIGDTTAALADQIHVDDCGCDGPTDDWYHELAANILTDPRVIATTTPFDHGVISCESAALTAEYAGDIFAEADRADSELGIARVRIDNETRAAFAKHWADHGRAGAGAMEAVAEFIAWARIQPLLTYYGPALKGDS